MIYCRCYLATYELDVTGALGVAISSTIVGTSLVGREARHSSVLVHGREVEGAVETAGKLRDINVECELLIEELEHFILRRRTRLHQIDTRPHIGTSLELQGQGVSGRGDTVCTRVVGSVERAVGNARRGVGTESGIPSVAVVAVGISTDVVDPAPVRVEDDASLVGCATATSARLPSERWVCLNCLCSNLLSVRNSEHREECICGHDLSKHLHGQRWLEVMNYVEIPPPYKLENDCSVRIMIGCMVIVKSSCFDALPKTKYELNSNEITHDYLLKYLRTYISDCTVGSIAGAGVRSMQEPAKRQTG